MRSCCQPRLRLLCDPSALLRAMADPPAAKRARLSDEWVVDANECTIAFLDPAREAAGVEAFSCHPEFTHQLFGEEERIQGYRGLRLRLRLSQRTFAAAAELAYDEKRPGADDVRRSWCLGTSRAVQMLCHATVQCGPITHQLAGMPALAAVATNSQLECGALWLLLAGAGLAAVLAAFCAHGWPRARRRCWPRCAKRSRRASASALQSCRPRRRLIWPAWVTPSRGPR
jgi:hypothetical protein